MVHSIKVTLPNAVTERTKSKIKIKQDLMKEGHEVNADFGSKEDVTEKIVVDFAHIEICKFQDQCRYYESCVYLHFSEQEPFLDSGFRRRFVYREEDFPQLQRTRKGNL